MRSNLLRYLIPILALSACREVADHKTQATKLYPQIHQCHLCGSTKVFYDEAHAFPDGISPDTRDYQSPDFERCAHTWDRSVSRAAPERIKSGRVILLRKVGAIAAVMPTIQSSESWDFAVTFPGRPKQDTWLRTVPAVEPRDEERGTSIEWIVYRWVYRNDGKGLLDPSSPLVKRGITVSTGASGEGIKVEDIQIDWSHIGTESNVGNGAIYFPRFPGEPVTPSDPRFCITTLSSFEDLDANDQKWIYKGSISDTSD